MFNGGDGMNAARLALWLTGGGWKWIAGAAIIAGIYGAGLYRGYMPEHVRRVTDNANADAFKAQVAAAGKRAEADKIITEKNHNEALKIAATDAASARAELATWVRAHPTDRTRGRIVPEPAGAPRGTDRAGQVCYDANALDDALQRFRDSVRGFIAEGAAAIIDRQELVTGWPR